MERITGVTKGMWVQLKGRLCRMKLPARRTEPKGAAQGPAWVSLCAYEKGEIMKLEVIASAVGVWVAKPEMWRWIPKQNTVWPQQFLPGLLVLG